MQALILIDIQNDYFRGGNFPLKGMKKAATVAAGLLDRFRNEGKPIVHVRHINLRKGSTFFLKDSVGSEIHTLVAPHAGEKVFIKHYPNSFRDTGMHEYLTNLGVRTIHIAGAMSNMCIDSTVRAGFDMGYKIVLHQKACAAKGLLGTKLVHLISMKTLGSVFAKLK